MLEFDDLTEEQKAKALACKTPEDLLALAEAEGVDLTDEELSAVSGGGYWKCDYDCTTFTNDRDC